MTDRELLLKFIALHDRTAMDALVRRYVDLVYASARRQVTDVHLAEDVTQAVFLTLARKAHSIPPDRLAGWLFNTTRYAACNARKIAARREHHERQAAQDRTEMLMDHSNSEPDPQPIIDELDAAIASLNQKDREAVIARYLQGRAIADVCSTMGISESAARKRLDRAVEKLRRFFVGRGITSAGTASVLAAMAIAAGQKASAASATLASSAAMGSATPAVLTLAKAAGVMSIVARLKLTGSIAIAAIFLTAAGTIAWRILIPSEVPRASIAPVTTPAPISDAYQEVDRIRRALLPPTRRYAAAFHGTEWVERYDRPKQMPDDVSDSRIYRDGDNVDVLDTIQIGFYRPQIRKIVTHIIAAQSFIETSVEGDAPPRRGMFNPDGPGMRSSAFAYLRGGNTLEGYFTGDDAPFWVVLAQYKSLQMAIEPDTSSTTQPAAPTPLIHISGDGFSGTYDLWCDPSTHALLHARVVKHLGNKVWHRVQVGKAPPPSTNILDEFWFEMTLPPPINPAVSTVPNEAHFVWLQNYRGGRFIKAHETVHRTSYQPDPDFAALGAFRPDLPDGAPMVGLDLPGGGRFTWHDGAITLLPNTSPPGSLQAALRSNLPTDVMASKWTLMPPSAATNAPTSIVAMAVTVQPTLARAVPIWMIVMSALGGLSLVVWIVRVLRRTTWRGL